MSAAEVIPINSKKTNIFLKPGTWVHQKIIEQMFGFTEDQLKKYRTGQWLEGKHWTKNPANRITYNTLTIDAWMGGEL